MKILSNAYTLDSIADGEEYKKVSQAERTLWNNKQDVISTSNKIPYTCISDAPTVPTKTSDLTNDTGFISSIPNATSSTVGGLKVRYDSDTSTLYITNDGSDA